MLGDILLSVFLLSVDGMFVTILSVIMVTAKASNIVHDYVKILPLLHNFNLFKMTKKDLSENNNIFKMTQHFNRTLHIKC